MRKNVVAGGLLAALAAAVLIQLPMAIAGRASDYIWLDPMIHVRSILRDQFVEPLDEQDLERMERSMMDALVASVEDPYTVYVPPQQRDEFDKQMLGTYVGIGAEISIVDGWLTIASPMDDSPALESGVMAGDTVLEIEGESTYEMPVTEAIAKLTGEPNTDVTIRVRHTNGVEETITITRRRIVTRTIKGTHRRGEQWNYRIDPDLGLGYVRVTQFTDTTVSDLRKAIDEIQKAGLNGLILDLRFDPGGSLESAVQMSDLFLEQGKTIVSVRGRGDRERTFTAEARGTLPYFPMIVLANETSASASEIVAGALQDNERAKILGERTYGKGSVQEVHELRDGLGTLKITTAYYYLPSGRNLHRKTDSTVWGVDPDDGFRVEMSDEQYRDMLLTRRQFEVITNGNGAAAETNWSNPAWIRETIGDLQLAAALEALQRRVSGEPWPRVGGESGAAVALDDELGELVERRNQFALQLQSVDARIQELRTVGAAAGRQPIVPEDIDLTDGTFTLRDKHGNVIGTYRITSDDFELALEFADLEKVNEDE